MKAIETVYNGYRFRSRLEARWAVFFDVLGIQYEYEKEGFEFDDGTKYLPDFWLPQVNVWAEVKPKPLTDEEIRKCVLLYAATGEPCMALEGLPNFKEYDYIYPPGALFDNPTMVRLPHTIGTGYLDEHRFFCQGYPDENDHSYFDNYSSLKWGDQRFTAAVIAAKSARFEHGERG